MIIFENKRIQKIKLFLKKNNILDIEKDFFLQRNENGWGIYSVKKNFLYFKGLTDVIMFSLPPMSYIAHKHMTDIDGEYYHYVLKTNDKCGIIIENEFLNYYEGLLFGFNPMCSHIVWNNGDTHRESLIFIFKKKNISQKKWFNQKMKIANKEYEDTINLSEEEIKAMTNKFKIKLINH